MDLDLAVIMVDAVAVANSSHGLNSMTYSGVKALFGEPF